MHQSTFPHYVKWHVGEDEPDSADDRDIQTDLFTKEGHCRFQESWLERCLTLGLQSLSKVFTDTTIQGKFRILGDGVFPFKDSLAPFMKDAVQKLSVCPEWQIEKTEIPEICLHDDGIEKPNEG